MMGAGGGGEREECFPANYLFGEKVTIAPMH